MFPQILEKWTNFQKLLAQNPCRFKKASFAHHWRTRLVDSNHWQNSLYPWDGGWSPEYFSLSWNSSLISKVNSQRHGFPLCSPQTTGGGWERGERETGRSYVLLIAVLEPAACHSRYSGGLFCVGVEREERFCHGTAKWEMTRFPQTWRLIGLLWIS